MTLDQVNALTPAERNRKIAEICGWKHLRTWRDNAELYISGWPPDKMGRKEAKKSQCDPLIPDYCGSLDACAQMESVLTQTQRGTYGALLHEMGAKGGMHPCYFSLSAPASDRSKAFLMVMLP